MSGSKFWMLGSTQCNKVSSKTVNRSRPLGYGVDTGYSPIKTPQGSYGCDTRTHMGAYISI